MHVLHRKRAAERTTVMKSSFRTIQLQAPHFLESLVTIRNNPGRSYIGSAQIAKDFGAIDGDDDGFILERSSTNVLQTA